MTEANPVAQRRRGNVKRLAVYAIGGIVFAALAGACLFAISFHERETILVWLIWCMPIALAFPLIRCDEANAFVASFMATGSVATGLAGAGINGPSTIVGGFASAWLLVLSVVLLAIWLLVRRFLPRQNKLRSDIESAKLGDEQIVSGNPYEPPRRVT
jgi:hypothetical protein